MRPKCQLLKLSLILLAAAAALIIFACDGCQSGTKGTFRPIDQQTLTTITNAIVGASQAGATVLPAPFGSVFEGVGALAVAGLALWQTITHKTASANAKAITKLQNDKTI
jgi:hypothetical protein